MRTKKRTVKQGRSGLPRNSPNLTRAPERRPVPTNRRGSDAHRRRRGALKGNVRGTSEGERQSGVPEGAAQGAPIPAQSAAVTRATASICNDEWGALGSHSGHVGLPLTLSGELRGTQGEPRPQGQRGRGRANGFAPAYSLTNRAGRFARKAFIPSFWSAVANSE